MQIAAESQSKYVIFLRTSSRHAKCIKSNLEKSYREKSKSSRSSWELINRTLLTHLTYLAVERDRIMQKSFAFVVWNFISRQDGVYSAASLLPIFRKHFCQLIHIAFFFCFAFVVYLNRYSIILIWTTTLYRNVEIHLRRNFNKIKLKWVYIYEKVKERTLPFFIYSTNIIFHTAFHIILSVVTPLTKPIAKKNN